MLRNIWTREPWTEAHETLAEFLFRSHTWKETSLLRDCSTYVTKINHLGFRSCRLALGRLIPRLGHCSTFGFHRRAGRYRAMGYFGSFIVKVFRENASSICRRFAHT